MVYQFSACSGDDESGSGSLPIVEAPFVPTCYEENCTSLTPFRPFLYRTDTHMGIKFSHQNTTTGDCIPDYIEVFTSTDDASFESFGEFDRGEDVEIPYFNQGGRQYVMVLNKHCELDSIESNSVMTTGETRGAYEDYLNLPAFVYAPFHISSDERYLAFSQANSSSWVYISLDDPEKIITINDAINDVVWSKSAPILYYITTNNQSGCHGISSLNVETGESKVLFEESNSGPCEIFQLSISNDETYLIYSSNLGNQNREFKNLWFLDLQSLETEVMTELESIEIQMNGFVLDPIEDEVLYLNDDNPRGQNEFQNDVYKFTVSNHSLEPYLKERFYDEILGISPDAKTMFLKSKRNGAFDYYSYNVDTKEFSQMTDFIKPFADLSLLGGLEVASENEVLIMVSEAGQNKLVAYPY